jgi:hypothetical protein
MMATKVNWPILSWLVCVDKVAKRDDTVAPFVNLLNLAGCKALPPSRKCETAVVGLY